MVSPNGAASGDRGHLAGEGQGPDHLTSQAVGGLAVHPAGLGGQVDDEAVGPQIFQFRLPQYRGGDGVDHQIIAAQPAVQTADLLRAVALGSPPRASCSYRRAATLTRAPRAAKRWAASLPNPAEAR